MERLLADLRAFFGAHRDGPTSMDGDVCDEPDGSAILSVKKNRDNADFSLSLETTSRAPRDADIGSRGINHGRDGNGCSVNQ